MRFTLEIEKIGNKKINGKIGSRQRGQNAPERLLSTLARIATPALRHSTHRAARHSNFEATSITKYQLTSMLPYQHAQQRLKAPAPALLADAPPENYVRDESSRVTGWWSCVTGEGGLLLPAPA